MLHHQNLVYMKALFVAPTRSAALMPSIATDMTTRTVNITAECTHPLSPVMRLTSL